MSKEKKIQNEELKENVSKFPEFEELMKNASKLPPDALEKANIFIQGLNIGVAMRKAV